MTGTRIRELSAFGDDNEMDQVGQMYYHPPLQRVHFIASSLQGSQTTRPLERNQSVCFPLHPSLQLLYSLCPFGH